MAIQAVKNGRYEVNVYLGVNSPRYRKQFTTLQEAKVHEAEIQLKILKGEKVTVTQKKTLVFQDVYEEWWNKKYTKTTTNTSMTYRDTERYFKLHILPFLGEVKIEAINYDLIENLQNMWAFGSSDGSYPAQSNYKKYINYTSKVFRYAVVKGYMKQNIFDFLDKPINSELKALKEQRRSEKYYDQAIINQTLDGIKDLFGMQAYVLLTLIYSIGAAKGEIYPLVWGDIDFDHQIIFLGHRLIKDIKTGLIVREHGMKNSYRYRRVCLDESLIQLLSMWKKKQAQELAQLGIKQNQEQFLFTYVTADKKINQPLKRDWLNRKLNRVAQVYGIPHLVPHGFRHTFISDSLNAGVNEFSLKGIVGHSAVSHVTETVYGHTNLQAQEEVFNALEKVRRIRTPLVHLDAKKDTPQPNDSVLNLVTSAVKGT